MKSRELRLRQLEDALDPETAWRRTPGLCALLQAAAQRPPRRPWEMSAEDVESDTGLGRLLREALQWGKEHG
jgi:hypothetical protein